ncbi:hypothetical protein Tco_0554466 [Tanacetum coccineum]
MDESYQTMEEYIELYGEKAQRRGHTFNWETATYEPVNDHVEINTELCSENIDIKQMDMVICTNSNTVPTEFDENLETNHDLRRNQVDDLKPTIEEGEVADKPIFDEVKTRNDGNMISRINRYPSYCDFDRKINIDCDYNLQFSCMIGFKHVNANFFLILSTNVMSKKFYNSILKIKVEYNGRNMLGTFMNAPIFIGNFSVVTDFTIVENMDAYRDEGMGEVIVGEPFCKASYVEARRFDKIVTIFIGNDSLTYQMGLEYTDADIADFEDRMGKIYGRGCIGYRFFILGD